MDSSTASITDAPAATTPRAAIFIPEQQRRDSERPTFVPPGLFDEDETNIVRGVE